MTVIDMGTVLDRSTSYVRENVRMFKRMRGATNEDLAEATGLTVAMVQARTMRNVENKNARGWEAGELALVAAKLRIPIHLFFMDPEDAWATAITLDLVERPSGCMAA
jgi:hypothetical protein